MDEMKEPDMSSIVALVGGRGVGKSTVANYLRVHYGYINYSLTTSLEKGCGELFDLSPRQLNQDKHLIDERYHSSPQTIFDTIETMIETKYGDDFWLHRGFDGLCSNMPTVVPNVRFKHEADELKRRGALLVTITRHDQERPKLNTDVTIKNNSSLSDLFAWVEAMLDGRIENNEMFL